MRREKKIITTFSHIVDFVFMLSCMQFVSTPTRATEHGIDETANNNNHKYDWCYMFSMRTFNIQHFAKRVKCGRKKRSELNSGPIITLR